MTPSPAWREKGGALRLLILGGTTEASGLARAIAGRRDIASLLSLAGRTEAPVAPPIPLRVGGFGGAAGLAAFLEGERIGAVIDATHPFAPRISANAVAACQSAGVPLVVFTRPAWQPCAEDCWISVPDIAAAVTALHSLCSASPASSDILSRPGCGRVEGRTALATAAQDSTGALRPSARSLRDRLRTRGWVGGPLSVFLTTGRLDLAWFREAPAHRYLVRSIDSPAPADLPPQATVVLARPPFTEEDETALMRLHAIDLLVSKNSGGVATAAKLAAARRLRIPVLMIERPPDSGAPALGTLADVLDWIIAQRPPP